MWTQMSLGPITRAQYIVPWGILWAKMREECNLVVVQCTGSMEICNLKRPKSMFFLSKIIMSSIFCLNRRLGVKNFFFKMLICDFFFWPKNMDSWLNYTFFNVSNHGGGEPMWGNYNIKRRRHKCGDDVEWRKRREKS